MKKNTKYLTQLKEKINDIEEIFHIQIEEAFNEFAKSFLEDEDPNVLTFEVLCGNETINPYGKIKRYYLVSEEE